MLSVCTKHEQLSLFSASVLPALPDAESVMTAI
jgi:hypothetical protein